MFNITDKIFVMGRSGCGKSFLARDIQKFWPRKIIIDSLNEYQDTENTVYSFDEFCEKVKQLKDYDSFEIIFKFDVESDKNDHVFNELMRISYYLGNVLIVIEEAQLYSSVHDIPQWLKNNVLMGRHRNIAMVFTSQRPGEVNKTILSQCHHLFVGSMAEGNDIRYISSFLNQDSQKLAILPARKFLWFNPERQITEVSNDFLKQS